MIFRQVGLSANTMEIGPVLTARNVSARHRGTKILETICSVVLASWCEMCLLSNPTPTKQQLAPSGNLKWLPRQMPPHVNVLDWCNSGALAGDWQSESFVLIFPTDFYYCVNQTECNQLVQLRDLFLIHQLALKKSAPCHFHWLLAQIPNVSNF